MTHSIVYYSFVGLSEIKKANVNENTSTRFDLCLWKAKVKPNPLILSNFEIELNERITTQH